MFLVRALEVERALVDLGCTLVYLGLALVRAGGLDGLGRLRLLVGFAGARRGLAPALGSQLLAPARSFGPSRILGRIPHTVIIAPPQRGKRLTAARRPRLASDRRRSRLAR